MGVKLMTLSDAFNRGFKHIGDGNFNSISLLDKEGETIKVIPIENTSIIDSKYLNTKVLAVGSSSLKPDRLRIRIDYLE